MENKESSVNVDPKITAIIVDDEKSAQEVLVELLSTIPGVEVLDRLTNVDDALVSVLKHVPDLIFLDIELPGKNGFELIHELINYKIRPQIIFVTAFNEYAISAIHHSAFDYLLKPINPDDLQASIDRFRRYRADSDVLERLENLLRQLKHEKIRFNNRTGFIYIDPDEIIYCEADGNYTNIYLDRDQKENITQNLGSVEGMMNDQFIKISRSTIINLKYLSRVCRKSRICFLEKNKIKYKVEVSKSYLKSFDKTLSPC